MDRNSPASYCEATQEGVESCESFVRYVLAKQLSRLAPVVTPRFVPTCTPALLAGCGAVAARHGVHIQTHVSESYDAGALVAVTCLHVMCCSCLPCCNGSLVLPYREMPCMGPSTRHSRDTGSCGAVACRAPHIRTDTAAQPEHRTSAVCVICSCLCGGPAPGGRRARLGLTRHCRAPRLQGKPAARCTVCLPVQLLACLLPASARTCSLVSTFLGHHKAQDLQPACTRAACWPLADAAGALHAAERRGAAAYGQNRGCHRDLPPEQLLFCRLAAAVSMGLGAGEGPAKQTAVRMGSGACAQAVSDSAASHLPPPLLSLRAEQHKLVGRV